MAQKKQGKTGKIFAAEKYLNNVHMFDLENTRDLEKLENPFLAFRQIKKTLIIIDEIQKRPDLFPLLRVIVDDPENQHKFLILGSASRDLIRQSSETLAGRIGYIEITPFSCKEVHETTLLWMRGGFPRAYLVDTEEQSFLWRKNYITTFLEQDIPALGFGGIPLEQLRRFWLMLAHYHGQIFNASELGRSLGVSHHTVQKYLDILTGTFMIRSLTPWFENVNKRQVKSPKIYFRDSGILHTLLSIQNAEQLHNNPKVGASWEGFALEEVIRLLNVGNGECFFWATHSEAELDLFMLYQGKRIGFEFKYADTPKVTKSMHSAITTLQLDHLYVITPMNDHYLITETISACGLQNISDIFR